MTSNTTAPRRSMPRTREAVLAALAEAAVPVTVTELAELAGVGRSTVSKHLPVLETEGLAVRTPGGHQGRRRLPDHWQAPAATPTEQPTVGDGAASPTAEGLDGTHTATSSNDIPVDQEAEAAAVPADTDHASPRPVGAGEATAPATADRPAPGAEQPDTAQAHALESGARPAAAVPVAAPAPVPDRPAPRGPGASAQPGARTSTGQEGWNPVSGSARLAPGELKVMVKALLDADPDTEFSATELSHLLAGRSIGAIQNNLARLATEGRAELTCQKPRRYRCAPHTA